MLDRGQSLAQYCAEEDERDNPEGDLMQSQTVYRQVQLSGQMHLEKHLLDGEQGKDNYMVGSDQDDEMHGSEQSDILMGRGGSDLLYGHAGDDLLFGDEGADDLDGGDGNDMLDGGDGRGVLRGGRGDDVLVGGAHVDYLMGGEGHDILIGGAGVDYLSWQDGDDIYRFEKGDGNDVIYNPGDAMFSLEDDSGYDCVEYGAGISRDQLWLQRSGRDLVLTNIETGDSQRVQQWSEGAAYRIDEFRLADGSRLHGDRVEALVTAMASFTMPAIGSRHFPPACQLALNPVLAQSWQ